MSERVSAGDYESANAVIREGLRLLQERDEERQRRLSELREAIDEGLTAAERGDVIDGGEAFVRLRARQSATESR